MSINDETKKVMKEILKNSVTPYLDRDNPTVVKVEYQDNIGAYRFESPDSTYFRAALSVLYRQETEEDEAPDFSGLLKALCDDAIYNQRNLVPINHRVAGSIAGGRIAYYLADKHRRIIVITPDGWKTYAKAKEKFIQHTGEMAQVKPVPGGDLLTLLRPYINLDDDDFLLIVIWIVQAYSRKCSHYALVISSPKGTGKSTLTKSLRTLIDPFLSDACLTSSSVTDLKNLLANTFMACFDNTAKLSEVFSNILCASITGTKEAKRKLYTDCDQVILSLHNLVILNGIDIIPEKSDLAERSLLFELPKIASTNRLSDGEYWGNFERDKPAILGAIFDTIQKAMQVLPDLEFEGLPRMADAYKDMGAIADALGKAEDFQRIFWANLQRMQAAVERVDPLVKLVFNFLKADERKQIEAPVKEVFAELKAFNELQKRNGGGVELFPSSEAVLGQKLKAANGALKDAGIDYSVHKRSDANYVRLKTIPPSQMTKAQRENVERLASLDK